MELSQKKMKGGTNLKKGLPPWATAPIARFIAYRRCCPRPNYEIKCDPNIYLYMFEELEPVPPPSPSNLVIKSIVYGGTSQLGYIYYNPLYSCINPYMIKIFVLSTLYGLGPPIGIIYTRIALKVSKDFPMFNKLIVNGPINFSLDRPNQGTTTDTDSVTYTWNNLDVQLENLIFSATAGKYILTFT